MTTSDVRATGDFERDADAVLERYWNLGAKVTPVPVDPVFIALAMSIDVRTTVLENGVDGMLVKQPGQDPAIYLDKKSSRTRQRFTCAHELGHWMKRGASDDWAFVDKRDQLSGRGTDPSERYANGFAAALLMPADAIERFEGMVSPESLADQFNVSLQAMGIRLSGLWARRKNGQLDR